MEDKLKTDNRIEWQDDLTPRSQRYDDIYFSPQDGLSESIAVFIEGIGVPDVWVDKKDYTICELGFGTGLNFLTTLREWKKSARSDQTLHYIATELFPLTKNDIEKAIHWEELDALKDSLLEQYPSSQIELDDGAVKITLLCGDSAEMLTELDCKIDAWYLDGFSPQKNPAMWSKDVFSQMARLSVPGAKLATFTAAGFVRRGLIAVGFNIHKRPGYGKKREMLNGEFFGTLDVER